MPAIPASRILRETQFAGLTPSARGKVRDIYDLGDKLLIVATDRLSAFDVILPTPIPDKGRVLTQLSLFWFELLKDVIPNHVLSASEFPAPFDGIATSSRPLHGGAQNAAPAGGMRGARVCFRLGLERLQRTGQNLRHPIARRTERIGDACMRRFLRLRQKRLPATTKIYPSNRMMRDHR